MTKTHFLKFAIIICLTTFQLSSCEEPQLADFELKEEPIEFVYGGQTLKGVLTKPENLSSYPLVIFVHGDGAMDRYQKGYNKYFWKRLNEAGIACMSWDKQGVGESSGSWLNQSLDDRAEEVLAAIQYIKDKPGIERILLWGQSQGCWVVPKTYQMTSDVSAVILQSAAVNWLRQGRFHLEQRLKRKNYTPQEIAQCVSYLDGITRYLKDNEYEGYKRYHQQQPSFVQNELQLIDEKRWVFVAKNHTADITEDLRSIDCPALGLFGEQDENVDALESAAVFAKVFAEINNEDYVSQLFPNVEHRLFDLDHVGKSGTEDDVWYKLLYKKQNVFAAGLFEKSIDFILNHQ